MAEREARSAQARAIMPDLERRGVSLVATSFVDNAGIARVKSVPLRRLPHLAAWGAGFSPSFDYFRFDDWLAAPASGEGPVGDLRIVPDLQRVIPLAAQPGWAWSPGNRYRQDGSPHPNCSRALLRRLSDELLAHGVQVKAADTSVLVRATIRAVGLAHGFRTSFSPKVVADGVGNGGHIHLSLWRDGRSLMAHGDGRSGLTAEAERFCAGILERLPALLAVGAPTVASYLRLIPSHWAGAYACWGPENREAGLRMITGSIGGSAWAANLEVKCVDLTANPYLLLAALLATGSAGMRTGLRLPAPVDVDPAALSPDELQRRGIRRLPETLHAAVEAFAADEVLRGAFGPTLVDSILAVRLSELERFADASPEEVVAATRWAH